MTHVIYKYPLETKRVQTIEVPQGGEVLTLQVQDNNPTLWIRHEKGAPTKKQTFMLIGTGHEFIPDSEDGSTLDYVGTCQLNNGALVFHLFLVHPPIQDVFREMLIDKLQQLREARLKGTEDKEGL